MEEKIIEYLNKMAGSRFRPVPRNIKFIKDRMSEGYEYQDFIDVIDMKVKEWKGTKMQSYLRPATLFNGEKFDQYVGQVGMEEPKEEIKVPWDEKKLVSFAAQYDLHPGRGESLEVFRRRVENHLEVRH